MDDPAQLFAHCGSRAECAPEEDGDSSGLTSAAASDVIDWAGDAKVAGIDSAEDAARESSFEVRLFKRDGASLGLALDIMSDGLLVSWVGDQGLADTWNRMCARESQLSEGDKIIACNSIALQTQSSFWKAFTVPPRH